MDELQPFLKDALERKQEVKFVLPSFFGNTILTEQSENMTSIEEYTKISIVFSTEHEAKEEEGLPSSASHQGL